MPTVPAFGDVIQYGALGLLGVVILTGCAGLLWVARAVVAAVERQSEALERVATTLSEVRTLAAAGACRYPGPRPAWPPESPTRPDRVRPKMRSAADGDGAPPRPA
jgi:hypothetical protein